MPMDLGVLIGRSYLFGESGLFMLSSLVGKGLHYVGCQMELVVVWME